MALLKCPSCEKEISESSIQCVHCGVEVKKCTECNTLVRKKALICKTCGCQFPAEPIVVQQQPKENLHSVIATWKQQRPAASFFNVLSTVISVLTAIFIIPAIFLPMFALPYIMLKASDFSYDFLGSVVDYIVPCIFAYVILIVALTYPNLLLRAFSRFFSVGSFQKWATEHNIDLRTLNKDALKQNVSGYDKSALKTHRSNIILGTKADHFTSLGKNVTVRGLLSCVFGISVQIFSVSLFIVSILLYPQFDAFITPVIDSWNLGFSDVGFLTYMEYIKNIVYYLVVGLVISIMSPIFSAIERKIIDNRPKVIRKWIEQEYTEEIVYFDALFSTPKGNTFFVKNNTYY